MMYLVDANVLIQAKNLHYSMDFCPAFWDFIDREAPRSTMASISLVYDELLTGDDELAEWIKERKDDISFLELSDIETQLKYIEIVNYVNSNGFGQAHIDRFLAGADPWLIAKSSVMGATLVTHEVLIVGTGIKKVKIPNICKAFGVKYINPFKMIKNLGAHFVLGV
jgi:hypothetical protein